MNQVQIDYDDANDDDDSENIEDYDDENSNNKRTDKCHDLLAPTGALTVIVDSGLLYNHEATSLYFHSVH